jgi:hypothetical protein
MEELINKLKNSDLKLIERETKIPYDRMYKWIKGKARPKTSDYSLLIDYFENGKSSIVHEGIPMYDSIATASEVEVYDDVKSLEPAFRVNIPQFRDCDFGKLLFGHSMYPTYESGSYLFCKQVHDKQLILWGEVYYIETRDYKTAKRLQKGDIPGELIACSDNTELRPNGKRRYEDFPVELDQIRNLYLVKGSVKQAQN